MSIIKNSGTIVFTQDDWLEFSVGRVSERLKSNWGFTSFEELQKAVTTNGYEILKTVEVNNNNYKVTIDGPEITRSEESSGEAS